VSNAEQFRARVADLKPLILVVDDTSGVYSQAFLVGDVLVVFPVDPDERAPRFPITETKLDGDGFTFDSPRHLILRAYPLNPRIDPELAEAAAVAGGRSQAFADTFVKGWSL
jgi:hypothetical protein